MRVVATSWRGADAEAEAAIKRADRIWVAVLVTASVMANAVIAMSALHVA